MKFGKLDFLPVGARSKLIAPVTLSVITKEIEPEILVSEIDPELSDTAAFCKYYEVGMDVSANCVIVEAKRADRTWFAACILLATTRADINGKIRRLLVARKLSFAPMDTAVSLTGMEYGGITPLGLPSEWPLLIDSHVSEAPFVIIGSGLRKSKLLIPGNLFQKFPNAQILDIVKTV